MCVMCVVMVRGVAVLLGAALVVVRLVCGGYRVALLGVLLLRTGAFLVVRTGSGRARVRLAGLAVGALTLSSAAHAETLQEALAKAYENNPTLTAARAGQRKRHVA